MLRATFAPLDRVALGIAVGVWGAIAILLATVVLVAMGGEPLGPHLGLLAQFFPGYTVTWSGSILGAGYGFLFGFLVGWSFAFIRNSFVSIYLHSVRFKSDMASLNQFLDE